MRGRRKSRRSRTSQRTKSGRDTPLLLGHQVQEFAGGDESQADPESEGEERDHHQEGVTTRSEGIREGNTARRSKKRGVEAGRFEGREEETAGRSHLLSIEKREIEEIGCQNPGIHPDGIGEDPFQQEGAAEEKEKEKVEEKESREASGLLNSESTKVSRRRSDTEFDEKLDATSAEETSCCTESGSKSGTKEKSEVAFEEAREERGQGGDTSNCES